MRKLPQSLHLLPPKVNETAHETILRIRAVTPVLGGGIDSFVPDDVDIVRIPSIRGALRWWWRALHPQLELDELRHQEQQLWGGVGNGQATASHIRLDVRVTKRGPTEAAGRHERRDGKLKALPTWVGGQEHGYALFPLQQPESARRAWTSSGDMPTKNWRRELEFEMRVDVADSSLWDAIALWLVFGGYGARTRRGFGALEADSYTLEKALNIINRVNGQTRPNRPTLAHCTVLAGQTVPSAREAHREMLAAMMAFRQGTSFGRNPGQTNRPGRSRWPEADSLRRLSGKNFTTHRIHPSLKKPNSPRAEFGLPLQIQFKDREDQVADGMIASTTEGGRFASPVLMRPVRRGNGYAPVVLILHGHRPDKIFVKLKQKAKPDELARQYSDETNGGAHDPVRRYLHDADGHAVDAFADWLEADRGFRHMLGGGR